MTICKSIYQVSLVNVSVRKIFSTLGWCVVITFLEPGFQRFTVDTGFAGKKIFLKSFIMTYS